MVSKIQKVQKRNGSVVEFDPYKIKHALSRAFQAETDVLTDSVAVELLEQILVYLEEKFGEEKYPSVEDIQNTVERSLMEKGYFNIARAYIVYRYEHQKKREKKQKDVQKRIEKHELYITKKNGDKQLFSMEKLKATVLRVIKGYEDLIDVQTIVSQSRAQLYDNISSTEIERILLLTTRAMIERDPAYSKVTARLLRHKLYKEVIGHDLDFKKLEEEYRKSFAESIKKGVLAERYTEKLLTYDVESLSKEIKIERDDYFEYLGLQTLYDRYFTRDPKNNSILETPQGFWMRVAMGLAINEENRHEKAIEFYNLISELRYVPSTPTLFHSGTKHPQLSSCYLTTVEDSLDHIFKSVSDNAQLSKWSGGIGNDWTNVRGTGSLIKGTGVESQGVVPFLKIANDTTVAINRSGRRRGATCAYLETWHFDIEDFLELRRNTGDERRRTHDMNTANWVPDLFMKRVRNDQEWTLFSPDEVPDLHHIYGHEFEERYKQYEEWIEQGKIRLFKKVRARDLWKKMISMMFETGHPWITWKDPCNVRSPQDHVGVVHSSNLCTEITLNTSAHETAVCNLGSVNMRQHIKDGKLDKELLESTVTQAMRMLDNVIDINFYPTVEAKNSNMKHRPVGLGIMGFQDALYLLDINFDSEEAIEFADMSMEFITYHGILSSSKLAAEKGAYKSYKGSKWDRGLLPINTIDLLEKERGESIPVSRKTRMDWDVVRKSIKEFGMRNSNCFAVAPTATIANISGCFPTIEPIYKNMYVKSNMSGEFTIVNHYLVEDLKALNLWDDQMMVDIKQNDGSISGITRIPENLQQKYKEVFDIDPRQLMRIAAHRGKWIDQSQSLNVFYKGSSGKELSEIYLYAWSLGLKTTYYLRTLAASSVEKSTVNLANKEKQSDVHIEKVSVVDHKDHVDVVKVQADVSSIPKTKVEVASNAKLCRIDDPDCEACQ